jgi:hypothetical protein
VAAAGHPVGEGAGQGEAEGGDLGGDAGAWACWPGVGDTASLSQPAAGDLAGRGRGAARASDATPDQATAHDRQTAELARHKLGKITSDDPDGYHRVMCPAAMGKIRCPLRPASMALTRDRPEILAPPGHPPACCTQQTIAVPPGTCAKTAQKHDYPSAAHRRSYARRTGAERTFSTAKDPASNNIARGWTRLMGLTPLMLWLACLLTTRNQRILIAWNTRKADDARRAAAGLPPKTRRRRRKTPPASATSCRNMAHNPAATGSISAHQYVARTRAQPPVETGQRRITRGLLPCPHSMTCTDSRANGSDSPIALGFRGLPFHGRSTDQENASHVGREIELARVASTCFLNQRVWVRRRF